MGAKTGKKDFKNFVGSVSQGLNYTVLKDLQGAKSDGKQDG